MNCAEYLNLVKEQIRNKRAKEIIEDELKDHLEEQILDYEQSGLSREIAEERAIESMGDPVEVGAQLDQVHRPRIDKKLILLFGILSLISLVIQFFINRELDSKSFVNQVFYTLFGIGIAFAIYHFDYTILGTFSVVLWGALLIIGMLYVKNGSQHYNSCLYVFDLVYWFGILFAGVMFQLRKLKVKGFLFAGLIGCSPILLALYGRNLSAMVHYLLFFLVMMNLAVAKQWFTIKKKIGFIIIWSVTLGACGIVGILAFVLQIPLLSNYQMERLEAIFNSSSGTNYITNLVQESIFNQSFFGRTKELIRIPDAGDTYVLTSTIQMFGVIAGILVIVGMAFLLWKISRIIKQQRSVLGQMVGTSCFLCLFVKIILCVGANFGIPGFIQFSSTQVLPFLSYGLRNAIFSYTVAGLLLSIYRNTDLVSDFRIKRIRLFIR